MTASGIHCLFPEAELSPIFTILFKLAGGWQFIELFCALHGTYGVL